MSSFKPAVRAGVGLLIGIAGATGSGKTFSALRLARGLADGDDSAIAFIDTEAGRALHYAPKAGEAPGPATFGFSHAELAAPFSPEAYLGKIEEAEAAGFKVIVIDSFSHVWAGEGGLQDIHDDELDKAVERARKRAEDNKWKFDIDRERDKASVGAWRNPKTRHKRMVSRLLQCRAHLVICMRAEDKLRMETKEEQGRNGKTYTKTEITPADKLPPAERWAPICEKRFPYELITSLVLAPDAPGVPIPLKLQQQHCDAVLNGGAPLDEGVGRALAAWARGAEPGGPKPAKPAPPPSDTFPGDFVQFGKRRYHPASPELLPSFDDFSDAEWKAFATALRTLIERAPDAATKHAWERANQSPLLLMSTRSPALRAWSLEPLPQANSTAPIRQAVDEGAPDSPGRGAGAPSISLGAN